MNRMVRNLWIQALSGRGEAYRRLGIMFLRGPGARRNHMLAKLCLEKAALLGDQKGYWLYHKNYSRKLQVIDDCSYEEMCRDYHRAKNRKEKKMLRCYLKLGTAEQKRREKKIGL